MTLTPENIFTEQDINSSQSKVGISILICTYNPEAQIFHRTLKSIESLIIPAGVSVECIITDNNSPTPVSQLAYVREFIDRCPWARIIQETQQGLTFARMAGFYAAKNSLILFIDDDNEVSSSYLDALVNLFAEYSTVGAWGPGNVNVEFMGEVSEWFRNSFKHLYQDRHTKYNQYGLVGETWASFYPFGTGLVLRREIVARYCDEVKNGNLCSSDRKGKSLSSGGDIQIVWEGIKMGYAAGVAPSLVVNHLIPANRSTLDYVKRLSFGTADSYFPCIVSSFPEMKSSALAGMPNSFAISRSVMRRIIVHSIRLKFTDLIINLANYLGAVSGQYQVAEQNNQVVNYLIQIFKLR
jgi:glycosyltransferase involved in cell wall biosynthesis